eukprot:SAG11_NODE_6308_length_1341_cov_0.920290_2_plen_117_part_00
MGGAGSHALVPFDPVQASSKSVWEEIERRAIEGAAEAKQEVARMQRSDSGRSNSAAMMSSALVPFSDADGSSSGADEASRQRRADLAAEAERELARLRSSASEADRHLDRMASGAP